MRTRTGLVLLLSFVGASSSHADILVLRDGGRVATQGAWREKDRLVVFRGSAGRLSSLPVGSVDLAASRAASAAGQAVASGTQSTRPGSAAAPAAPRRAAAPGRVFSDEQFSKVDPATLAASSSTTAAAPRVTLYSTSWCGWCRKTRALLTSLGVAFTEKDVERDPAAAVERTRKSGRRSVPVLDIGGTIIVGYDEARTRELLKPK